MREAETGRPSVVEPRRWYVVTGAPSSGKTTLLKALEGRGARTVPEAARVYIDEELARGRTLEGIRSNELAFQREVLRRKVRIESALPPEDVLFLDRGLHDSVAFYRIRGFAEDELSRLRRLPVRYVRAFLMELGQFEADYARSESPAEARELEALLEAAYAEAGIEVVRVPWMSVDERLAVMAQFLPPLDQQEPSRTR
jgi:predicted ATPase